jgi:putative toxin-antitoxin system antitoxin component (TIGR02293 family)
MARDQQAQQPALKKRSKRAASSTVSGSGRLIVEPKEEVFNVSVGRERGRENRIRVREIQENRIQEIEKVTLGSWTMTARLLGLPQLRQLKSPLDVHDRIERGLPSGVLKRLIDHLVAIPQSDSLEAIGMSLRTFQRLKDTPKPLDPQQSARTWKFAEVLAKATEVFGSQEDAEQWLEQPAIALDQRRPIDLLKTPAGAEMVETLLERIEYGVYT